MFQVAGIEAPIVGELLRRRDLKPISLAHAAAYAKRNSYLTVLTVPRGVVDIAADLPPRDVAVVAATANLLARNEVHPALMYLLLDTAAEINSGACPALRGEHVPESAGARPADRGGGAALLQVRKAVPARPICHIGRRISSTAC